MRGLVYMYRVRGDNYLLTLSTGRVLLWKCNVQDPGYLANEFIRRIEAIIGDKGVYGKIIKYIMLCGVCSIVDLHRYLKSEGVILADDELHYKLRELAIQGAVKFLGRKGDILVSPWISAPLTHRSRSSIYEPLLTILWHESRSWNQVLIDALKTLCTKGSITIPEVAPSPRAGIRIASLLSILSPELVTIDKESGEVKVTSSYSRELLTIITAQRIALRKLRSIEIRGGDNPELILDLIELANKLKQ